MKPDFNEIKNVAAPDLPSSPLTLFIVLAFRYGEHTNTFPIGVFRSREAAMRAAHNHYGYRGGKYQHRVYEFQLDQWDDDVGHVGNNAPCIEATTQESTDTIWVFEEP